MGGSAWQGDLPAAARPHPLLPESIGYLQHIDLQRLNDRADAQQVHLYLAAQPGSFVHPGSPLLWCTQPMSEEEQHHLQSAFTIGEQRSYEQDPRFGLCVLAEIASRALSPAVNDPGTAIDIIGRAVRLFGHPVPPASDEVAWPRIFIRPAQISDMFDDVFTAIGRDGAGLAEVQIRLQKSLQALALIAPHRYAADAQRHARLALARANMAMNCAADKTAVERAAIWALPEKISCD